MLSQVLGPVLDQQGVCLKITPTIGLSEEQIRILHGNQNNLDDLLPEILSMARNKYASPEPANRLISILDDVSQLDKFLRLANLDRSANLHNAEDLIVEALSNITELKGFLEKTLGDLINKEFNNRDYNTAYAILDICREFGLKEPVCASQLDNAVEKVIAA
jgi:hypothetical protein